MLAVVFAALLSLTALPADEVGLIDVTRFPPHVWTDRAWCISDELYEESPWFAEMLWAATRTWDVDRDILIGSEDARCIHVGFVDEATWKDPDKVGITGHRADGEPVFVVLRAEYWNSCPEVRWSVLLHEVGHAVGFIAHSWHGVMEPSLTCDGAGTSIEVSNAEREYARRIRKGL